MHDRQRHRLRPEGPALLACRPGRPRCAGRPAHAARRRAPARRRPAHGPARSGPAGGCARTPPAIATSSLVEPLAVPVAALRAPLGAASRSVRRSSRGVVHIIALSFHDRQRRVHADAPHAPWMCFAWIGPLGVRAAVPVVGAGARGLRHHAEGRERRMVAREIVCRGQGRDGRGRATTRPPSCSSASKAAPPAPCWPSRRSSSAPTCCGARGEKAQALSVLERFIKLHPSSPGVDYALYLQGVINFNDNLGILGSLAATRTCPSATSRPRATPTSRSSSWSTSSRDSSLRRRRAGPHELHRQLAGGLRGARGALLLPARRLRGGGEPRAAGGAGVPALALGRRGAGRSWCRATTSSAWPSCATTRSRVLAKNFPEQPLRQRGPDARASAPGGSSGRAAQNGIGCGRPATPARPAPRPRWPRASSAASASRRRRP